MGEQTNFSLDASFGIIRKRCVYEEVASEIERCWEQKCRQSA